MAARSPKARYRRAHTILGALLTFALWTGPAAKAAEATAVVVELFTSQGCSSCPPADKFLGELAERDGVVALSFHVDYWDYIGWKDRFALTEGTERQRAYARTLGNRFVYTPQMVIDGVVDESGASRAKVDRLIEERRRTGGKLAISLDRVEGDRYMIVVPAVADFKGGATVWLVLFDRRHRTPVARGENAGREIFNYNVVRDLRRVGAWTGEAVRIPITMAPRDQGGCAVIVQRDRDHLTGQGQILGAVLEPLDGAR